jgi:hypothetical protein
VAIHLGEGAFGANLLLRIYSNMKSLVHGLWRRLPGTILAAGLLLSASIGFADITGNPLSDGWAANGNSLASGVYANGGGYSGAVTGQYNYNTYSATLTVGSTMQSVAGWNNGDTVVAVGGVFVDSNAALLANEAGIKLQAKFATSSSAWNVLPPGSDSFSSAGAGGMEVKSSSVISALGWDGQNPTPLIADSNPGLPGVINLSTSSTPIVGLTAGGGEVDPGGAFDNALRFIWTANSTGLQSWEILLDVSQIPLTGLGVGAKAPASGDQVIMTVQQGNGGVTDALVSSISSSPGGVVPEPASLVVWSLLGLTLGGVGLRRKR